jgi:hypothetical protein
MRKVLVLALVFGLVFASTILDAQKKTTKPQPKKKASSSSTTEQKKEALPRLEIKQVDAEMVEIAFKPGAGNFALYLSNDTSFPEVRIAPKGDKSVIASDTTEFPSTIKTKRVETLIATEWSKKGEKLVVTKLSPKTEYAFALYKVGVDSSVLIQKYAFSTLAAEPSRQAQQISFGDVTDTTITLRFIFGNGEGRMLVGAKGEEVDLPQDGKEYRASARFGSREAQLGKSFVLYDGKDKTPQVTVTNLEPGTKYTFAVFEYNGNGKYRNYNVKPSANNPRSKITRLKAPEILKVELIAPDGAFIRWKKVANAVTYILDVATDEEFRNKVDVYNEVDVGDLDTFELSDLVEGTTYYIRLKARGNGIESLYSKPVKFTTNK